MKIFQRKKQEIKRLPVLIIPGFMSSGLEVKESDFRESWVGERIWLNLVNLGISSFVDKKGKKSSKTNLNTGSKNSNASAGKEEEEQVEPEKDLEAGITIRTSITTTTTKNELEVERERAVLANAWIHHMSLQDDLVTEREGIQVRPIPGLAGVDYLAPGLLTNHASYVFGPVIHALTRAGYEQGVNLDAAPYDWRLPPSILETRDQYFTRTMDRIEEMYARNSNTPVVLVCHSMGCKVGHYLLNFALKARGQAWIDQHVHTYCPVGAPHLGAPKALRALISGDKMGLDTFLTDDDGLIMGRSLGSAPLLLPTHLPSGASACAFLRMDGAMEVTLLSSIDTDQFLGRREPGSRPDQLRLTVVSNGHGVTTPYRFIDQTTNQVQFKETFTFRTEAHGPRKRQKLAIMLCEPGASRARKSTNKARTCHLNCRNCFFQPWKLNMGGEEAKWGWPPKDKPVLFWLNIIFFWWLIYPLVRYSIEFAFKIAFGVVYGVFTCLVCGTVASFDEIKKASGGSSVLAVAKVNRIRKEIIQRDKAEVANEVELELEMVARRDMFRLCGCCRKKRKFTIKVRVKWIPPQSTAQPRNLKRQPICQPDPKVRPLRGFLRSTKGEKKRYAVRSGHDILNAERLGRVVESMDQHYEKDKIDPRGVSSLDPPPIRTILAIYGKNLPTEVGTIFKRRHAILGNCEELIDNKLRPDNKVSLKGNDGDHTIKNGVLYETGSEIGPSGDGTVPYWSLSHVYTWATKCDVKVHEVEGAEHREILADKRLHDILIDYCCQKEECATEKSVHSDPLDSTTTTNAVSEN